MKGLQSVYDRREFLLVSLFTTALLFFGTIFPVAAKADWSRASSFDVAIKSILDTTWVLFAGCLVFLMNIGFLMVENGFTPLNRGANINVIAKNLIVFSITAIAFYSIGFSLMFSNGGDLNPFFGTKGWFLLGADNSPTINDAYVGVYKSLRGAAIPLFTKFFFHLTFAGTAATIVSGSLIGRVRFSAFCLFTVVLTAIIYPVCGHIVWGGGFLQNEFWDFAGSTVVHSVGGWAGLSGALILRSRRDVTLTQMKLESAAIGCLILWLGWLGFNAGSDLEADPEIISHIFVVTIIAGSLGGISAFFWYWLFTSQTPSISFLINGVLAGCVSITASCRYISPTSAIVIGFIGGIIVVAFSKFFSYYWTQENPYQPSELYEDDKIPPGVPRIDDPVGAISVHLCCGVWGTWAVGLFAEGSRKKPLYEEGEGPVRGLVVEVIGRIQDDGSLQSLALQSLGDSWGLLISQIAGTLIIGVIAFSLSYLSWKLLDFLYKDVAVRFIVDTGSLSYGIRVSKDEEELGIDRMFAEYDSALLPVYQDREMIESTAKEVKSILENVSESNPTNTEEQKRVVVDKVVKTIEADLLLKKRIVNTLKSAGIEAFREAVDHPLVNILMAAIEGWKELDIDDVSEE